MEKPFEIFKVSEIKIQYLPDFKLSERPIITKSSDAYKLLLSQWDTGIMQFLEEFKIILLNNANHVLGIVNIAMGGKGAVMVDMRVIFSIALTASASKIILAHNHPSGKLIPSSADRLVTNKALEAGKVLDIEVCDHIILTSHSYLSMKDNGDF
ncbi:JAB domain-containing protein [Sphingobacterium sp. DR205]|uniref:JAB domain-containing protein n=1 Tax=Sphingobacterium sp. DR205 TaxID=2713573 RepID=UPI0013E444DB|nr:JAB domain-containing protein [Sphingobacterium sp. DR205]QIH33875.1 JAB domain-containing protein [Sphingobacterium sp. DR205]